MNFKIYEDGSFDIYSEKIHIENAFSALDGYPVRPVSVKTTENSIIYKMDDGQLALSFAVSDKGVLVKAKTENLQFHDIEPVFAGHISGADECFVQGFGMEGPSGYYKLEENTDERRIIGERELSETEKTSYGLTTMESGEQVLGIYVDDYRHFTTSFRYEITGKSRISCSINTEGVEREQYELPTLIFTEGNGLAQTLKCIAQEIAQIMGERDVQAPAYHWCSWYYMYQTMTQADLEEYLAGMKDETFKYIQIDAGYSPSLGDWLLPNFRFPEGLKKAAKTITDAGFGAGIWVGVFMVGDRSTLYKEHPDWMLRKADGELCVEIRSYNEPKAWGNPDCNYYILDTSNPEALAYVGKVFRTLKEWGFTLFKTDFMLWCMKDGALVKRYDPSKTSVEIYRDTLKVIREAIGEESYWLGCIAPFMPSIGYADGMRIAGDVGAQWEGVYGPRNMIREVKADNYFNHIFWQNDPDSVLLRNFDIFLNGREIESLALLQAMSGGVITTSDPTFRISEERKELLRMIKPDGEKHAAHFPYMNQDREDLVITQDTRNGKILFAMNISDKPLTVQYRFKELFEESEWHVCRWKNTMSESECERADDGCEAGLQRQFADTLAPHGSALLFLTKEALEKQPANLWAL